MVIQIGGRNPGKPASCCASCATGAACDTTTPLDRVRAARGLTDRDRDVANAQREGFEAGASQGLTGLGRQYLDTVGGAIEDVTGTVSSVAGYGAAVGLGTQAAAILIGTAALAVFSVLYFRIGR